MADAPATPDSNDPPTAGAAPAPGSDQGQAGGSPPAQDAQTSGGNEGEGGDKALRRRLTEQGEELAEARNHAKILEAAMATPEWASVQARLMGKEPTQGPDPDISIFGDDPEALAKGKAWKAGILKEAEERAIQRLRPVVQQSMSAASEKALERAIKAQGLPADTMDSEAFQTFRTDFAEDNEGFADFEKKNPGSAFKWLASSFAISAKRNGREPVGDRADASLERGGGSAARVGSAASPVKIAHNDPQKIHKLLSAIEKGEQPVDEAGNPYPVKRR